jgi:hypothetical protein
MSEIITDKLTGKTTAGDVTITSEGGAVTMQLQQGLAKAWVNFNGTGTIAARDSLNLSSLSDNNTGNYTISFTNSLGNANYLFLSGLEMRSYSGVPFGGSLSTGSAPLKTDDSAGSDVDRTYVFASINGDLA